MDGTVRVKSLLWFLTGAAVMLVATVVVLQAWRVDAAPGETDATFVPITPCRLIDTRQTGQTPLTHGETRTVYAHGGNYQCTLPPEAVGLSMNVTALDATTVGTYLTIWPDGQPQPNASSLNPSPGQPPTPNAVTTPLSSVGKFKVFNFSGTVGLIIDINGYYTKGSLADLAADVATLKTTTAALDAAQPFAVTNTETAEVHLIDTPTAYVSVTVTAPVTGHVTLNSTAGVHHSADSGDVHCAIYEDPAIPASVSSDEPSYQRWETSLPSDNGSLSGTRRFDIAAGAPTTYSLACEEGGADGGLARSGNLTAIFTPAPPP